MKRAIATLAAGLLALTFAAPAAGWYEEEVIDPAGSFIGPCADPRVKAIYDNTASTVPVLFKWVHKAGNQKVKPARRVHKRWVDGGDEFTTKWHWVRGGGAKTRITYWNTETRTWDLLDQMRVRTNGNRPWGSPGCVRG